MHYVRVSDVISGSTTKCRSCSSKQKMANVPKEVRVRNATKASRVAAITNSEAAPSREYKDKYGSAEYVCVRRVLSGAKQRCTNPNAIGYENYGGRGIEFRFPSITAGTVWVLENLGTKPSRLHSIDRVDNNRHYESGNLRWATRTEQANNKRQYRRSEVGERIRELRKLRPDLTYETIRMWIKNGLSDADITNRRKYTYGSSI